MNTKMSENIIEEEYLWTEEVISMFDEMHKG